MRPHDPARETDEARLERSETQHPGGFAEAPQGSGTPAPVRRSREREERPAAAEGKTGEERVGREFSEKVAVSLVQPHERRPGRGRLGEETVPAPRVQVDGAKVPIEHTTRPALRSRYPSSRSAW